MRLVQRSLERRLRLLTYCPGVSRNAFAHAIVSPVHSCLVKYRPMTLLEKSTSIKANSYFARARARERARAPDYGFQINLIAGAGEV